MESIWFIIIITLSFCATIKALINLLQTPKKLPPGPVSIPIITSFQWLRKSFADLEPTLRNLKTKYGPIVTLSIGHRKSIFITTSSLAHQALIQNGAIFADRPPAPATSKIVSSNQHNISGASYGPLWRLLRRNLTMQILHPSKIKSFSPARNWVLNIIKESIKKESNSGQNPVLVVDHFQFGMFCLLVFMCFGEKLDEKKIREVESVQRSFLLGFGKFQILNFFPKFTKIFLKKRWEEFYKLRNDQEKVLIPLIRSRQEQMKKTFEDNEKSLGLCYVDSLLNIELPDEGGRKLTENEIVSLCSEFLNAGTDTTSTALQWVMANLVKYQEIQSKLYDEIKTLDSGDDEIKEEDLKKLPYLKAVILEGLRRHPPGHFVLPHAVTQDIGLDGYVVPKEATVNVMIAEIGWDSKVWEDPMMFKPERFLSEDGILNEELSDVTGNKEVKMIPFGAGRRMCPASGLAMLHLEYFVANLIKEFKWTAKVGDDIDLSEKQEFTIVMKNPLWAHVSPREQDWVFNFFSAGMLAKLVASPVLTLEYATRSSLSIVTPIVQPNIIKGNTWVSISVSRKKWELHSAAQTQIVISGDEEKAMWESCKQALSAFNFNDEEEEKILGKAFGQLHSPYWGEERTKEVPKLETVNAILDCLKSLGLADEDIYKLLKKFPEVLGCNLETELKNNVQILEKVWAIKGKTLRSLLLRNPKVLGYTIDCKGDCAALCTRCWVRF
ncbi:hypothetical protein MKW98_016969 [Papaver atlanticum]|uniref:Cytochrome P450 n=1 Tax=Papaver atlanticum TaxID=357466 RepID=A0AAD4XXT4_9MAGN|nr:hypothetical protein MKW98_016969 [Papaver atlanticum]